MYDIVVLLRATLQSTDYADRVGVIAQEGGTCTTLGSAQLTIIPKSAILKGWYIYHFAFYSNCRVAMVRTPAY